ncbi:M20/M25/M40 family metallo-hydrolase [Acetobacter sp. TBRC 12305]|uniref:M20/M25/M40 family metallo-hydrolase n=1 Tax=Acetobacter garciniae TaxID=2817435 RepID=A0A939HPR0_9PROT|nr:M20/M25/M40 family metallo-hydrolase [Acetobacter garciniae]MBO1325552.1 M20/M25/M40 family metallo-hydrolase [Acetobacter garciniae]MBX0345276.1 M20/M25/M40 family metallo-hydrolase [Acetobacter garciniae]
MSDNTYFDQSRLREWALRFARFPSQQTHRFEMEPEVQNFLGGPVNEILTECGLPHVRDRMGNVIVDLGGPEGAPSLTLMAYAMTHPASRMERPFAGEVIDDGARLRGRGLSEQKGALTAAMAAVAAARDLPRNCQLSLIVTSAGETGRHDAAQVALETLGYMPDAAVIVVGTGSRLALANKGRIDIDITVRGKVAHSSTPWAGVDAITGARKVLDRVMALDVRGSEHPGLGHATLTATAIRSWPEATHTIQDEVRMTFDRRLLPGDDPDAAFDAVVDAARIGAPWQVEAARGPHMFPAEIKADGPMAQAIAAGCALMDVPAPEPFYSNGSLDAGLFHAAGSEAAMWGPGDMNLWHSNEESIGLDEIEAGARAYLGLIRSFGA